MPDNEAKLNHRAVMALLGIIGQPEKVIATLLRSDCLISPEVRHLLADAFEAKGEVLELAFKGKGRLKKMRAIELWKARIGRGRAVEKLIPTEGYTNSVRIVSQKFAASRKAIEADLTVARRAERWANERAEARPDWVLEGFDHIFATALANLPPQVDEVTLFAKANSLADELNQWLNSGAPI